MKRRQRTPDRHYTCLSVLHTERSDNDKATKGNMTEKKQRIEEPKCKQEPQITSSWNLCHKLYAILVVSTPIITIMKIAA